ncbi:5608_t:CDS:2, partial [Funneliformis geosporum]
SIVVRFFNASHQPNAKLQELIKANNVQGGGLKKYVSTRWHTCYDHLESIWRLRICLIIISDNYSDLLTNYSVKQLLCWDEFYQHCKIVADILKLICDAILEVEGHNSNLADCFMTMIKIAQGLILTLFCRLSLIATQMLKNMGHNKANCQTLVTQMRKFDLKQVPFDLPYAENYDTPLIWWMTCKSFPNFLEIIAIRIFGMTPHSASCERLFSTLGWFMGTHRTNLSIS